MLEIKDLCVSYGAIDAVKGISLKVNDGEIVSLIGANGAGKTTTLHTITGLVPASRYDPANATDASVAAAKRSGRTARRRQSSPGNNPAQ